MISEESSPNQNLEERQPNKCFNKRICFAYTLSIVASLLVVFGLWGAYRKRDHRLLLFPVIGICLIFIGSCCYRSGWLALFKSNHGQIYRKGRNRIRKRRNARESQLFESQLSLNMLPQCFTTAPSRFLNSTSNPRYLMLPMDQSGTSTSHTVTTHEALVEPRSSLASSKSQLIVSVPSEHLESQANQLYLVQEERVSSASLTDFQLTSSSPHPLVENSIGSFVHIPPSHQHINLNPRISVQRDTVSMVDLVHLLDRPEESDKLTAISLNSLYDVKCSEPPPNYEEVIYAHPNTYHQ